MALDIRTLAAAPSPAGSATTSSTSSTSATASASTSASPSAASSDDLRAWMRAAMAGFLRGPDVSDEEVKVRGADLDPARTQGAFEPDGRCVGTFRTFSHELTVPGGAPVTSCAVSTVTVSPTHRRRGLLTRMMRGALDAAKERGEACASLGAAEYRIYGRYGFGPASFATEFEVDAHRSGLDRHRTAPDDGGRVDFADPAEVRALGPALHDRFRRGTQSQGAIDRNTHWWQRATGQLRHPHDGFDHPFHVLYRDADGAPQGLATYTVTSHWKGDLPDCTAQVKDFVTASPAAERALWHFLLSIDWVSRVRTGTRPPDDLLPQLLPDPRAARIQQHADFLWIRPLDVPRMLRARSWPVAGRLVLEVRDPAGYADGRYLLQTGPDGAQCTAGTRESADLTLGAGELGALYLGDESAVRLAALGLLDEHRPGAAVWADTLFRTPRRPWCPDMF